MFGSDYREIEETTNGIVFNIEHFHVHDGEGIRTNVFLKGCNLHCPWCCNPESISPDPQIAFYKKFCTGCGKCQNICPQHCIEITGDGKSRTDRSRCIACGACEKVCPHGARELFGYRMNVAEVMKDVEKDSFYFMNSDGGMTLSGGETCLQPEFRPETFLPMFAKAGADIITFQLDACPNPLHMLREVKKAGIKAGLGIGPSYDVERLRYLLPHIDGLILMSVEPGYGGQPFEESIYEKVKRSVEIMDETGIHVPISIDGGVNTVTGKKLVEAGADILIAGSSVFGADSITDAVKSLKAL